MKKFDRKSGLSFGVGMTVFFIIQSLWTAETLTVKTITISIVSGLLSGIFSGFFFGLIMGWFKTSKFVDTSTKIDTQPDENILFQTGANHFKGAEGVGGKLYLTNKRLVFKSHKLNIQNHEFSTNLTDIEKVDRYKSLGVINNGLTITTKDKKVDNFVVEQADDWIEKLS
jgi:hypothetical protein